MPSKRCSVCKEILPSSEYQSHVQAHKHASRPPHWTREGEAARRMARKRDQFRCRTCGRTIQTLKTLGLQLEVHHIDGNRSNLALANLICQCSECHDRRNPNRAAPLGGMPA